MLWLILIRAGAALTFTTIGRVGWRSCTPVVQCTPAQRRLASARSRVAQCNDTLQSHLDEVARLEEVIQLLQGSSPEQVASVEDQLMRLRMKAYGVPALREAMQDEAATAAALLKDELSLVEQERDAATWTFAAAELEEAEAAAAARLEALREDGLRAVRLREERLAAYARTPVAVESARQAVAAARAAARAEALRVAQEAEAARAEAKAAAEVMAALEAAAEAKARADAEAKAEAEARAAAEAAAEAAATEAAEAAAARAAEEIRRAKRTKAEEELARRKREQEKERWAEFDSLWVDKEDGTREFVGTDEDRARMEAEEVRAREERNKEVKSAASDFARSLFGVVADIGLSIASSIADAPADSAADSTADADDAAGSESAAARAAAMRDELRAKSREDDQRSRLSLFEAELGVLGVPLEDAGGLDEPKLRQVFRKRSRLLHPDLNPAAAAAAAAAEAEGEAAGGGEEADAMQGRVVPTIYELNQAYESVKKML